jgi:guanosine-3',5'-bis(diphosphate) 3'-pyrophosphohydrolase
LPLHPNDIATVRPLRASRQPPHEHATNVKDISLIFSALDFAADKHRYHRRKDEEGTAYINHLITVAQTLWEVGKVRDPTLIVAALLHDTLEDTETTPDELEREFGARVRSLVAEVTDDKSLPKDERKRRQIEHAPFLSPGAKHLKLCDLLSNVRHVTHRPAKGWSLERRREYLDWTEQVIAGCRGTNAPLEDHYDGVLARGTHHRSARGRHARPRVPHGAGGVRRGVHLVPELSSPSAFFRTTR